MQEELFKFLSKYVELNEEEKQAITSLDIFKVATKGKVLLQEGKKSLQSYFVLKGCIRCFYIIDGEEKTTAFYTEKEGLTPTCVLNGEASEYSISCVEDSFLLVATPDMEEQVFSKYPRFETLCRLLSEDLLVKQQITLDQFKTSSPEQRYLKLIETRPDLIQRAPQHQIASYLGVKPQSLSRMRSRIIEKEKSK